MASHKNNAKPQESTDIKSFGGAYTFPNGPSGIICVKGIENVVQGQDPKSTHRSQAQVTRSTTSHTSMSLTEILAIHPPPSRVLPNSTVGPILQDSTKKSTDAYTNASPLMAIDKMTLRGDDMVRLQYHTSSISQILGFSSPVSQSMNSSDFILAPQAHLDHIGVLSLSAIDGKILTREDLGHLKYYTTLISQILGFSSPSCQAISSSQLTTIPKDCLSPQVHQPNKELPCRGIPATITSPHPVVRPFPSYNSESQASSHGYILPHNPQHSPQLHALYQYPLYGGKAPSRPSPYPQWHAPIPQNAFSPSQSHPSPPESKTYLKEKSKKREIQLDNLTPIGVSYTAIYQKLHSMGYITPIHVKKPFISSKKIGKVERCAYHSNFPGHNIENCYKLKEEVERLIKEKIIHVEADGTPVIERVPMSIEQENQSVGLISIEADCVGTQKCSIPTKVQKTDFIKVKGE